MRYVALLLVLLATTTQAKIIATMPNEGGGHVMLTDLPGKCGDNSYIALANNDRGVAAQGCWTLLDDQVLVSMGGNLYIHDTKYFTPYQPKQPRNQKDRDL